MRSLEHSDGKRCFTCENYIKNTHAYLAAWFFNLRRTNPCLHIQQPLKESRRIRLFQIDEDGNDRLSEIFFQRLAKSIFKETKLIRWAGKNGGPLGEFYLPSKKAIGEDDGSVISS